MDKGDYVLHHLCVECVRLVGVERAEWAAVYRGDLGFCPDHLPTEDSVIESMRALEASENPPHNARCRNDGRCRFLSFVEQMCPPCQAAYSDSTPSGEDDNG